MAKVRVAVIGCGPCGISVLASFKQAEEKGEIIPEIVCYEKQESVSGMWNFTWRTGVDEYGEPVHGGMYKNLWPNTPKECLEMSDYSLDEHFKKLLPSYLPQPMIRDYILGKVKKYNIEKYVLLNTVVRNVEEDGDKFRVTTENLKDEKRVTEAFDYVIVATGHFSTPNFPEFEGIDLFKGRILHSHDFREAEQFKGKNIVLIGSHYSADDIAIQCWKYGAKKIAISYRKKPLNYKWPENLSEFPELSKFEENQCVFVDGSKAKADAVIFCTGYQHNFSFMDDKIRLRTTNILYPNHLYKGLILNNNPKVIYMGMQELIYTFTLFDSQAWYVRDYILEKITVASKEERTKDIEKWHSMCLSLTNYDQKVDFQRNYMLELFEVFCLL